MPKKFLLLCGIAAPVVYVFAVLLGGLMRPGYSHFVQAVSGLIETGAPNKPLLDPLFALYNVLTIGFGIGLLQIVRAENGAGRKRVGTLGALCLILEGLFGFVTVFFPQDPGGPPTTSTGTMHIVLAGLSSLTTMLTMVLIGFWFRSVPRLRNYALYSFLSVLLVFVSGGLAAASIAGNSPNGGLLERLTIGGFLQWMFVIALKLYSRQAQEATYRIAQTHGGTT